MGMNKGKRIDVEEAQNWKLLNEEWVKLKRKSK
jgi:hypothetical protein